MFYTILVTDIYQTLPFTQEIHTASSSVVRIILINDSLLRSRQLRAKFIN